MIFTKTQRSSLKSKSNFIFNFSSHIRAFMEVPEPVDAESIKQENKQLRREIY